MLSMDTARMAMEARKKFMLKNAAFKIKRPPPLSEHRPFYFNAEKTIYRCETASTTAKAVIFTIRRTVADGVKMCTGLAQPSKIGPIATPLPAVTFKRL